MGERVTAQLQLDGEAGDGAEALVPERPTLPKLREAAADCTACPLYENATQTVFGEGLKRARLMLVGEQPGDREDIEGRPFVGPAGSVLDKALEDAGVERADAYVTNAVKHFKWKPRGKRRIHQAPNAEEIRACSPWLAAEIEVVGPELLVCLGATAAKAVIGPSARIMRDHGQVSDSRLGPPAMPTLHPSAILRADPAEREDATAMLVDDLRSAKKRLG